MRYEAERIENALRRLERLTSHVLRHDSFRNERSAIYGVERDTEGSFHVAVNVTNSVCIVLGLPFNGVDWTTRSFNEAAVIDRLRTLTGLPWVIR